MKRVFLVHRWSGGPLDDWRAWLKKELEQRGCVVVAPEMPDTEVPVIEKWVTHLASLVGTPDDETYFVGHSIGCQTILRYLETINTPVGGAVFVAGWFDLENLEDEETEEIAHPWIHSSIDLDAVRSVLPRSTVLLSDNDPFGAFEKNKEGFEKIGSKVIVLPGAGHITANDGFIELPECLKELGG